MAIYRQLLSGRTHAIGLPLIVASLSILGAGNHPALEKAWEFLNQKTDENGKLVLDGTLAKQPCNFGKVGQPNKWVSFYSLLAEKYTTQSNLNEVK